MEFTFFYNRTDYGKTTFEKVFDDSSEVGAELQWKVWKAKEEDKCRITIISVSPKERGTSAQL